jgi:hypothetical protein
VKQPGLDALQILNGDNISLLKAGIDFWKRLLMDGQKVGIVAGSDSHGNFNCFRQISIPFLKMVFSRNHLFGSVKTGVRLDKFTLTSLLDGIRNHQTVISNGPFACLHIPGNETLGIGNTIKRNSISQLIVSAESTSEYGFWNEVSLFWGNCKNRHEIKQSLTLGESSYTVEFDIQSIPEQSDYVRLEAYSSRESLTYFCITSPIWMID